MSVRIGRDHTTGGSLGPEGGSVTADAPPGAKAAHEYTIKLKDLRLAHLEIEKQWRSGSVNIPGQVWYSSGEVDQATEPDDKLFKRAMKKAINREESGVAFEYHPAVPNVHVSVDVYNKRKGEDIDISDSSIGIDTCALRGEDMSETLTNICKKMMPSLEKPNARFKITIERIG